MNAGASTTLTVTANSGYVVGSGYDYGSRPSADVMNDLWEYLPASGQWVWVTGSNTVNALAVHGTVG